MSLKIIKQGILDSIQDLGRYGYRQYGINPTGVMDPFACCVANSLVGNNIYEAVIELHFPASTYLFESAAIIALTGANFGPTLNDQLISNNSAIAIPEKSTLRFTHPQYGATCYLAVAGGFELVKWLDSYSTNIKAAAGGLKGTRLSKETTLSLRSDQNEFLGRGKSLPESITDLNFFDQDIMILPGNEWNWLSENSQTLFLQSEFLISSQSDRMGYRLDGKNISAEKNEELVSSPVCFGTIQLLPNGQLIILMADHQTTGGYPRIANVISTHLSVLAQKKPGDHIRFRMTDIVTAENLYFERQKQIEDCMKPTPI